MKDIFRLIPVIAASLLIMLGCSDSDVNKPDENKTNEITIGALVSLSGNWSSLGMTSKAALEMAVAEINEKFEDDGTQLKFTLKIMDTKLDPDLAYAGVQELIADGVEVIIGPQSSAELLRVKPLLDQNNIFAVSMSSTAGSLALNGDHVLRFCPDDKPEGLAVSKLMWERNIRKVVAVYRDDEGNIGLKKSMTTSFTGSGGVVIDSIKYSNDDNITNTLIEQISASVKSGNNTAETAVYLAGFDEVAEIFALAAADETLSSVLWFGSNGSAMSAALISNTAAARFANNVEFCSPLFALSEETEAEWSPVSESIEQSTGLKPEAYTFAAYDAVYVAALAYKSAGDNYTFDSLLSGYIQTAGEHQGMTGLTELNSAGDRKYGNFTMLGICGSEPNYSWMPVGSYNTATGSLIYNGCN
jgi:branched-chain amino acid transport system substrate-binding protein